MSDSGTSDALSDHREEQNAPDSSATKIDGGSESSSSFDLPGEDQHASVDALGTAGNAHDERGDAVGDDTVEAVIYTELMRASGESHGVDSQTGPSRDGGIAAGDATGRPREENSGFFTSLARFLGLSKDDH